MHAARAVVPCCGQLLQGGDARAGTGEVERAIASATFHPQAAAFTALLKMCAKERQWEKALEVGPQGGLRWGAAAHAPPHARLAPRRLWLLQQPPPAEHGALQADTEGGCAATDCTAPKRLPGKPGGLCGAQLGSAALPTARPARRCSRP